MKKVIGFGILAISIAAGATVAASAGDRETSVSIEKVTSPGTGRELWLVTRTNTKNGVTKSAGNLHRVLPSSELLQGGAGETAITRQQAFRDNPSIDSINRLKVLRTEVKKQRR